MPSMNIVSDLSKMFGRFKRPFMDTLGSDSRGPHKPNPQNSEQYSSTTPAEKKRKLDHLPSAQPEDTFAPGVALSRYASGLPDDACKVRKGAEKMQPWGVQELREVDKKTIVKRSGGQSKRRRRDDKPSNRSSPYSTQLTQRTISHPRGEDEAKDRYINRPTSTLEQDCIVDHPGVIVVDNDQEHSNTRKLSINLASGLDKTIARSQLRRARSPTYPGASSARTSPPSTARWVDVGSGRDNSVNNLRGNRNDQVDAVPIPEESNLGNSNLRNLFVRDNGPSREAESIEDDELIGPTNVHGRTDAQINHSSSLSNLLDKPRASSPADIRATEFSTRATVERLPPGKRAEHAEGAKERVPIKSLICSSMQLKGQAIELAWDSQSCCFHVLLNGQRRSLLETGEPASIGPKIKEIKTNECTSKVLLRCAADPMSNGKILIEFGSWAGKRAFVERASTSTRPEIKLVRQDLGHFNKMFQKLTEEYLTSTAYQAQRNRAPDERRQSHDPSPVDEQIVYESQGSVEEQSTNLFPITDQELLAITGHGRRDTKRKPEHDEATDPSSREGDRRSTRRSLGVGKPVARSMTPPRWTQHNDLTSWRHPVVYPPLPALRRVTIDKEDIGRLDEGEFLNDTILSFALREIEESMTPRRREEIYMFNTFFYTALSTKRGKKGFNFDAVKTWTRKVDIFKYPFVVVPINVSLHWFVAIICNLPSVKSPPQDDAVMDDVEEIEPVDDREQNPFAAAKVESEELLEPDGEPKSSQIPNARMSQLSLQDGDAKLRADALAELRNKTKKFASRKHAPPVRKLSPKGPFIITLDSLNLPRSPEVRYLKDYIAAEAMDKLEIVLDPKEFQGITAKGIPEQNNFCDCGIFAVRYIQALAEDPRGFVKDILERQVDGQRFDGFNPSDVRDELRNRLLELSKVNEEEFAAKREKKRQSKREPQRQPAEQIVDRPASSPVDLAGNDSENSEESETPVAVDLAEPHTLVDSTVSEFVQHHGSEVISPPSRPGHRVSLRDSSTPDRPTSQTIDALGIATVRLPKH